MSADTSTAAIPGMYFQIIALRDPGRPATRGEKEER
jgi:hypothetical protein